MFEPDGPIGFAEGSILTVTLHFNNNDGHNIGRPRLSVTTQADCRPDRSGHCRTRRPSALRHRPDKRTAEQKAALLKWYRTLDPDWRKLQQSKLGSICSRPRSRTWSRR